MAGTPEEQEELGRFNWAAPSQRWSTERHNRLEQRGAVAFGNVARRSPSYFVALWGYMS